MTKEKALEILRNDELTTPWTNDQNETWFYHIGELFGETSECFVFVGYPHSTKRALDLNHAYLFYVMKDNGKVLQADSPMCDKEWKQLKKANKKT